MPGDGRKDRITDADTDRMIAKRIRQLSALVVLMTSGLTLLVIGLRASLWMHEAGTADLFAFARANGLTLLTLVSAVVIGCAYVYRTACRLATFNHTCVADLQSQTVRLGEKNEQLRRLKKLSEDLIGQVDLKVAFDLTLEMAIDVVGARTASIMLMDDSRSELTITAARGIRQEVIDSARVRVGEGLAGMVAQEGHTKVIDSDDLEESLARYARRKKEIRSAIIAPIKIEGVVRGVMNVSDKRGGEKWAEEDKAVVSTLAGQAAMVLQKIELYEDLQRQVVMLKEALGELRETQASLVQSEKLASIGQIAGGVAHEINNPLSVILGRAEFALDKITDDHPVAKDLDIIRTQTERIAVIVRNLLGYSRTANTQDARAVDINGAIEQSLALTEQQLGSASIAVIRSLDDTLPQVWANVGHLQQVFVNIIINALQAMRGTGGTLSVSTWHNMKWVFIRFRDTGPGIAPDDLEKIFEPFFTTKGETEGTGLGLAISRKLMHSYGGKIEAGGEPGDGAVFTIDLPAMESPAGELEDAGNERQNHYGSGRRERDTRAVS